MAIADFGDSKVTVKKYELLANVRANRAKHVEDHAAAQIGYQTKVIEGLRLALEDAEAGRSFTTQLRLEEPVEHTKEYDRVIRMLEMSVADEVTITEKQFTQFVLDDWTWKSAFAAVNSRYH